MLKLDNCSDIFTPSKISNHAAIVVALVSAICMSTCCFFGFYGNIVSTLIFAHHIMRSPINVLLVGLSLIDLSLVILALPVFVIPATNQWIDSEVLNALYPYTSLILYPITMVSQTCSIWTFVIVSVERYLAVCKPLMRHKLLTCREAKIAQITIVAVSFSYNLVRFWEYGPSENFYKVTPLLRNNTAYFYFYYTALYEVTHFVLPFFLILLLNLFIIRKLGEAPENLRRFSRSQIQQRKITTMIVLITMMFTFCNLLPFILNIWEAIDLELFEGVWRPVAYLLVDVSNCLVVLNSSSTFLIYLMCCRKYRLLFKFYGHFQRPPPSSFLNDDNNVQYALVRATFPLRAMVGNFLVDRRRSSVSNDMMHRTDSTAYSA